MPIAQNQTFARTSFKQQADVLTGILRNNPILDDADKKSVNETVGVLTWLNQLQLHWTKSPEHSEVKSDCPGSAVIPEYLAKQIFDDRKPQSPLAPVQD